MGGPGSGNWYRWNTRDTTEETRSIDAGRWARDGAIVPGERRAGSWGWYRNNERVASIGYETDCGPRRGTARLIYTYRAGALAETHDVDYRIALTSIPSNLGIGRLWFFECPAVGCGRRVKKLYLGGRYFACRRCYNLTYESCNQSHTIERLAAALAGELGIRPATLAAELRTFDRDTLELMRLTQQTTAVSKRIGRMLNR